MSMWIPSNLLINIKICVWCFNKLTEESGKCPHCRRQYNLDVLNEITADPKE
jgi:ribosomal protein L40E